MTGRSLSDRVVALMCHHCSYAGADQAGQKKLAFPPNVLPVRVPCTCRVDPRHIIESFRGGAAGVLILGCHPGDCHFRSGNLRALCTVELTTQLLSCLGVEPARLRLDWASSSQGDRLTRIAWELVETVRALGPLEVGREPLPAGAAPVPEASEVMTDATS